MDDADNTYTHRTSEQEALEACQGLRTPGEKDSVSLPLYMKVAWWAFLHKEPVTVEDISDRFDINYHRSRNIFSHLNNVDHVKCERLWILTPLRERKRALIVTSVNGEGVPNNKEVIEHSPPVRRRRSLAKRGKTFNAFQKLRTWMVSRRHGEKIPSALVELLMEDE